MDLHERNAAKDRGCDEPGHVRDDPAAEADQRRAAVELVTEQLVVNRQQVRKSLVIFADGKGGIDDFKPRSDHKAQCREIERTNLRIGNDRSLFDRETFRSAAASARRSS